VNTADSFAKRLAVLVDLAGSQYAFAQKTGVTPSSITNWLTKGMEPRTKIIRQIANRCGVNEDWLATGSGLMESVQIETDMSQAIVLVDETPENLAVLTEKELTSAFSERIAHFPDIPGAQRAHEIEQIGIYFSELQRREKTRHDEGRKIRAAQSAEHQKRQQSQSQSQS
jgi:transcriptional regulator with XRE-family HTH domain